MIAWIRINDTNIHYPIMQGKDNEWYKRHNWQEQYSTAGSIFLDCKDKIKDKTFTIYGNDTTNENYSLMLGDIKKFYYQDFFDNHKDGSIFIPSSEIKIEVIAVMDKTNDETIKQNIGMIKDRAIHWRGPSRDDYDKLIFLEAYNSDRCLVLAGYGGDKDTYICKYCDKKFNSNKIPKKTVSIYEPLDNKGTYTDYNYHNETWCNECAEVNAIRVKNEDGHIVYRYYK